MLEKIKSIKRANVVRDFAEEIHGSTFLTDAEEKSRVVTALLKTAIAIADDFHICRAPYYAQPLSPEQQVAQQFVNYCTRCGCEPLIPSIIDKLADTSEMKTNEAREKAEKLMSVLVAFWSKTDAVTTHASQSLESLRRTTVDLILQAIKANPKKLTQEQITALLKTAIKKGDTEWLNSEYVVIRLCGPQADALPGLYHS